MDGFAVDGTPVDCVKLALCGLLPVTPDLVVSGINLGPNMGVNVFYSGTVAGAIEGAIQGVTSMAVSLATFERPDYSGAAAIAALIARTLLEHPLPPRVLLNVNVPNLPLNAIRGIQVTAHGFGRYGDRYRVEPQREALLCYPEDTGYILTEHASDDVTVRQGYAAVTPLSLDLSSPVGREWCERHGRSWSGENARVLAFRGQQNAQDKVIDISGSSC